MAIVKVIITSGRHKGTVGDMPGDLYERRKTLGKEGKTLISTSLKYPNDKMLIRLKHVEELTIMQQGLIK
jgi:hypothetical protein